MTLSSSFPACSFLKVRSSRQHDLAQPDVYGRPAGTKGRSSRDRRHWKRILCTTNSAPELINTGHSCAPAYLSRPSVHVLRLVRNFRIALRRIGPSRSARCRCPDARNPNCGAYQVGKSHLGGARSHVRSERLRCCAFRLRQAWPRWAAHVTRRRPRWLTAASRGLPESAIVSTASCPRSGTGRPRMATRERSRALPSGRLVCVAAASVSARRQFGNGSHFVYQGAP